MNSNEAYQKSDDFQLSNARPKVVVGVLVYNEDKVLLVTGDKFKGKWVLFGGHVEMGQSMEDAVKVEAKEEVGLDVEDISFIKYIESIGSQEFTMKKHFIFMNFAARGEGQVKLCDELTDYKWFSFDEVLNADMNSSTRSTVEEFLHKSKKI